MAGNAAYGGGRPESRWRVAVWGSSAALMLLPVLAIRMADDEPWDPGDFIFLGILLLGVGAAYELAVRVRERSAYRAGAGIALAAAFLQLWINLAVGIIGSEDNQANLMYGGVIAVAVVGAVLGRFHPVGMAHTMIATAVAQALVFVTVLMAGLGFTGPITVFFTALWLLSAWLFRKAARQRMPAGAGAPG